MSQERGYRIDQEGGYQGRKMSYEPWINREATEGAVDAVGESVESEARKSETAVT